MQDQDQMPGSLKPSAIAVLKILEKARGRSLTTRTIYKKLSKLETLRGYELGMTHKLMWDMMELGLVGFKQVESDHSWTLNLQLAVRP